MYSRGVDDCGVEGSECTMYIRGVDDCDFEGSECTVGVSMILILKVVSVQ